MKKENSFSTNLLLLLRKQNITQKKFAQMLNTKESVISRWLTGKALPSSQSILKITEIFNVPAGYFFDDNKTRKDINKDLKNDNLIIKLIENQNKLIEKINTALGEKIERLEKDNLLLKKEIEFLKKHKK